MLTTISLMKKIFIILTLAFVFLASVVYASETNGTVTSGGNVGYAWGNQSGWVNFGLANGNLTITDAGITGYAWDANYGWINMAPSNGGVLVAANGALSGSAWGASLGWINFSGVSINSSGKFVGQALGTTIGTLTFDCANCSVVTDYRPADFRTPTISSGQTSSGSSSASTPLSSDVSALDVSLTVAPSQSRTLTQNLTDSKKVELTIENNTAEETLTFVVGEERTEVDISSPTFVIGGAIFNIQAFATETGERVRSFAKPIQITLTVPEELQGRDDVGVYFLDEDVNVWEKISDVTFSGESASFFVDHLTLFGIFSASDLPVFIQPFFTTVSVPAFTSGATPGTEAELEGALPAQLFDIRLLLDRNEIPRIEDLVARVTFESFGRVSTPVEMTFTLLDAEGNKLWTSVDTTTVQTSAVFVKRFTGAPSLTSGSYTARLDTLYNTDVRDTFEAPFTVLSGEAAASNWILWFMGGIAVIALILLLFLWRRRF